MSENDQLKNLVETLKKENDKLKRKAQNCLGNNVIVHQNLVYH